MSDDAEAAQALHVFDHVASFPTERIRCDRQIDGHVVPGRRADLDGIETEDAPTIRRWIWSPRTVTVIGKDDKPQTCAGRRRGDVVRRAAAVGSIGVNVDDAGNGAVRPRGRQRPTRGRERGSRENDQCDENGGGQSRRGDDNLLQSPAAERSEAALSVRSQVNSGSVRPKWPNAAVFL